MKISIIVAQSRNGVIGKNNQLPWHLPADLAHFKKVTMGKPIVMGRKTFESIGRPLPGRKNIVISRQKNFQADGCDVFHSIDEALASLMDEPEIMIIGGANIYEQLIDKVDQVYRTVVDVNIEGDAYFPELPLNEWVLVSEESFLADEKNQLNYAFQLLVKK